MSQGLSAYTCTPRQVRKFVTRSITKGLVPYIRSSPGMGKSAIVRSIAEEYNLELIDHRLSTSAPEDLSGLPHFTDGKATFMPFDMFPTEDMPLPPGKDGWILFLDEMNSAPKSVQAAAYKLVLDKMVGLKKLHPRVLIVCAGNLDTDRAIVNPLSTAMQSRVITLVMDLKFDEFLEDVMLAQSWDNRIIAYLSWKPSNLHDFRPDHNEHTFCCPRTWEFMNKLIKGEEVLEENAPHYAGTITSGVANEFIQFTKIFKTLPKIEEIMRDPMNTDVPRDPGARYATALHLTEHVEDDNISSVAAYVERFPTEIKVVFYRTIAIRKPALIKHPASRDAFIKLSRYLNDDDSSFSAAA